MSEAHRNAVVRLRDAMVPVYVPAVTGTSVVPDSDLADLVTDLQGSVVWDLALQVAQQFGMERDRALDVVGVAVLRVLAGLTPEDAVRLGTDPAIVQRVREETEWRGSMA